MTREETKSCIGTIEMLQRLAYNIHGVMDVIDVYNCKKIIKALEQEPTTKNDLGVDCINRDSAIKALGYDINFDFKPGVSKHMDDIAKLLNTIYETQVNNIKALPSVTPQEPRWIPVSERLPTKEEYIANNGLFIVSDGNRTYAEYFDVYDSMKYFGEPTMNGFRVDRCVTAWMPLPEPYKAESEDKE